MAEAFYIKLKNLLEIATEELKINRAIERAKARVKIMEGEEQKVDKIEKQEYLGYKFPKKFLRKDLRYLCENSRSIYYK